MKILWIYIFFFFFFLGGGGWGVTTKIDWFKGSLCILRYFLKVNVQKGDIFGVAKISNIIWGMSDIRDMFWGNSSWVQASVMEKK